MKVGGTMFGTIARAGFAALVMTLALSQGAAVADERPTTGPGATDVSSAPAPRQAVPPPIVSFMHSNSGWMASFSFADPVTEIQWSSDKNGPFESTGFLQTYDPQTRRPMANPGIELDANLSTIYVRYVDLKGNWIGPFAIPFDPEAEIKRSYRSILETTTGAWLAFRHDAPKILYYTHISGYRCGVREFRVGIDKPIPDRVVTLAPCDMKNPNCTPQNVDTHLMIDPSVMFVSAQLVYRDGTRSKVKIFRR